jgi:hypothetical protein
MGAALVAYYEKAKEKGGLESLVKLAMLTKMSKQMASEAEDSPANIAIVSKAMAQL